MPRAAAAAVLTAILLAAAPAAADKNGSKPPDAARVRTAAEQYDAGVAANKAQDFQAAASHFEAADAAVPSGAALRQAIKSRAAAGQGSRAATLAAQALERYPGDEGMGKFARETIEKFEPSLQKVSVSCASPCVLAVGTRSVPGDAGTRWVVYLDPGKTQISASFFGGASTAPKSINAKAGGSIDVRFEPEEKGKPAPPPPVKADAPPKGDDPPKDAAPDKSEEPPAKGISPAFFGVALAATAGLAGTTIWSGIDTQTNPGPDAVKAACAGKGTECELYQEGLSKQRRTNILIGATAGTAAVTVVLAIFTRWRSPKKPAAALVPLISVDHGAVVGAAGSF